MNDDRRKMLTEYIGECWHEALPMGFSTAHCQKCTRHHGNRTFTTWSDLGVVKEAIEESGDVSGFLDFAFWKYAALPKSTKNVGGYVWWLFTPDRFCELAAELLEGRHANKR